MERDNSESESDASDNVALEGVKFGVEAIREFLNRHGLDVNDDGFVVDRETGELAEPYAFSPDADGEPASDPLAGFCVPESESSVVIIGKDKIHLSDLHTVYEVDGKARPIRDDSIALQHQFNQTGYTYSHITEWSDNADLIDQEGVQTLTLRAGDAETVDFNCFNCGHSCPADEWGEEHDDETGLEHRCPECEALWDINNIQTCTHCQTTFMWEELMEASSDSNEYWEPFCPNCSADGSALFTEDRYKGKNDSLENAPVPTIEEAETDSLSDEHFEKAQDIDNRLR